MGDVVIDVAGLGKQYQIGELLRIRETGASLGYTLAQVIRHPRALLRRWLGAGDEDEIIWALRDVSFQVERGEVIGIIGHNGAGKSTLLKILTRITDPTEGYVRLRGRVGSLLEVGTGFQGMLTGRENTYLNGAILGMKKHEVDRKFDEIVDFAGVEKFIDTPVRRYSTGMYLRLAFAVAAHLEPDILLVDEVLAVGDAAFQRKCLGKMSDVAQEGRTVLFVSHNMAAVEYLCSRGVLLDHGSMVANGPISDIIAHYMSSMNTNGNMEGVNYHLSSEILQAQNSTDVCIKNIELFVPDSDSLSFIRTGDTLAIRIHYETRQPFTTPVFGVRVKSMWGQEITRFSTRPLSGYDIESLGKQGYIDLQIESLPLTAGRYFLDVGIGYENIEWAVLLEHVLTFDVERRDIFQSGTAPDNRHGLVIMPHSWDHHINVPYA